MIAARPMTSKLSKKIQIMDPETFETRKKNFEKYKKKQNEMKTQMIQKKMRANSSGSLSRTRVTKSPIAENLPWTMTKEEWKAKMMNSTEENKTQEEDKNQEEKKVE